MHGSNAPSHQGLIHKAALLVDTGNIPKAIVRQPLNNSFGQHYARTTPKSAFCIGPFAKYRISKVNSCNA
jgi:hypothetical protein